MHQRGIGMRPGERRLAAASLAASLALHAAALLLPPFGRRDQTYEPPRVLSVILLESQPLEVERKPDEVFAPPPLPKPSVARPRSPDTARRISPAPRRIDAPVQPVVPRHGDPPVSSPKEAESDSAVARTTQQPEDVPRAPPESAASHAPPDFRAEYLRNPPPPYPLAARRGRQQGTVMLKVLVSRDGLPKKVDLERSSGTSALDESALRTVLNWRFVPAKRGGEPIEAWVLVPVVFRLDPTG